MRTKKWHFVNNTMTNTGSSLILQMHLTAFRSRFGDIKATASTTWIMCQFQFVFSSRWTFNLDLTFIIWAECDTEYDSWYSNMYMRQNHSVNIRSQSTKTWHFLLSTSIWTMSSRFCFYQKCFNQNAGQEIMIWSAMRVRRRVVFWLQDETKVCNVNACLHS
jgi:hypothetical protein